jgi:hypothetical protein
MSKVKRTPFHYPPKKHGRPPRAIIEAREFGEMVERERKPYEKTKTVFYRLHRRNPKRWKSERTMFRLWKDYHQDKARQQRCAPIRDRIRKLTDIRQRVGKNMMLDIDIELENFKLTLEEQGGIRWPRPSDKWPDLDPGLVRKWVADYHADRLSGSKKRS